MTAIIPERCPTCSQRWPKQKAARVYSRICRVCKAPIATHHKWMVQTDGEASWFMHRNCDDPTSYGAFYPGKFTHNPTGATHD